MIKIIKNRIYIILMLTLLSLLAVPVFASEFSFNTQNKSVSVGEQFKIDLNINTNKENINAVEGKIVFSSDYFELSEIRAGNSIINFWIDKPAYNDGGIVFSGITPGGYVLDNGLILSLVLKARKEGDSNISIQNGSALKNDGNGTKSNLKISDLQINISNTVKNQQENLHITDNNPPDSFNPEIGQDPSLFNDKWFVAFIAQDKGTGVAKYEVKESLYNIFNFSKWITSTSPYMLTDQQLQSNIYVKAIDNSGNERVVKLSPKNPLSWYANIENWFIITLVIAIVALIYLLKKARRA
jgi:hypothetical protein